MRMHRFLQDPNGKFSQIDPYFETWSLPIPMIFQCLIFTLWLWLTVCHGKIHHAIKFGKPWISNWAINKPWQTVNVITRPATSLLAKCGVESPWWTAFFSALSALLSASWSRIRATDGTFMGFSWDEKSHKKQAQIAELVNITPISLGFMLDIYIIYIKHD